MKAPAPEQRTVRPASAYRVCQAERSDLAPLLDMQEQSLRALGRGFYSPEVIEGILREYGTMDPEVIDEGHYYAAITADGRIVGSGGWSCRTPGYSSDRGHAPTPALDPGYQALIRSVFVHPNWARQGIGRALVAHAEVTAAAAGNFQLGLTSTLSEVPLYRALGYREVGQKRLTCHDGTVIETVEMAKRLSRSPSPPGKRVAA